MTRWSFTVGPAIFPGNLCRPLLVLPFAWRQYVVFHDFLKRSYKNKFSWHFLAGSSQRSDDFRSEHSSFAAPFFTINPSSFPWFKWQISEGFWSLPGQCGCLLPDTLPIFLSCILIASPFVNSQHTRQITIIFFIIRGRHRQQHGERSFLGPLEHVAPLVHTPLNAGRAKATAYLGTQTSINVSWHTYSSLMAQGFTRLSQRYFFLNIRGPSYTLCR